MASTGNGESMHLLRTRLREDNGARRLAGGVSFTGAWVALQEEIAGLHARAAEWFAQNGFIGEAIEHALAAGDEINAVRLVEKHRDRAMNYEHWRELEQWLGMLPRRLVDARPELLMSQAWILQNQGRFEDLPGLLDRIEGLVKQQGLPKLERSRLRVEVATPCSIATLARQRASTACNSIGSHHPTRIVVNHTPRPRCAWHPACYKR